MAHKDIVSTYVASNRIDPLTRFGVTIPSRDEELVADWKARATDPASYKDQKRYNRAKWDATEDVLDAWKNEVRAHRSTYDIFFDTENDSSAFTAIEIMDGILDRVEKYVFDQRVEWGNQPGNPFEPSYWAFKGLFDELEKEIAAATGDAKKVLEDLHGPLTSWSNNSATAVEKFGFTGITADERHDRIATAKAARKDASVARRAVKVAKSQAEYAAEAADREAVARRNGRPSIAPQTPSTNPTSNPAGGNHESSTK